MSAPDGPALSRRRVLTAAAGLGAASAAGLTASCTGGPRPAAAARPLADAVLEAFKTHRLVGLGEIHGLQTHGDALALLLSDPRLGGVVDDVVVEFGNALYQDTIDAFTAGQPVNDADLRLVWRNTTTSPLDTYDEPMYEQAYRTIRAANWAQPPGRRMRVLLGDGPIDWAKVTTSEEYRYWARLHGPVFWAPLVKKEVLAKGRRALLCFGLDTFTGPNAAVGGERIYRIVDLVPPVGDLADLAGRLAGYPRYSVIPTAGTWLGSFDAEVALAGPSPAGPALAAWPSSAGPHLAMLTSHRGPGRNGKPPPATPVSGSPYCGKPTGSLIEAALYLGQPGEPTASWPDPAIYLDPVYWKELQRRNRLGISVDLEFWRQEHPVRLPPVELPPSELCQTAHAGH
jgi:hypothetical protein